MRRLLIPALAGALVLSACSEPEPEVTEADVAAIEASLVNGSTLAWELTQAETRVASMCMQDEGFTVHDTSRLHGNMIPNRFEGFDAPYARIPTVAQAEKFGFGTWVQATDTDAALAMREDVDYLAFTADDMGWLLEAEAEDDSYEEWQAMGEEYHEEWTVAFVGAERAAYDAAMSEAFEEADSDAEYEDIDVGEQPPFGGCELETIEIVYGEPVHHEVEGDEYWSKPDTESPLTWIGDGELYAELSADYAEQEEDFLVCVGERGHGEWEFDDFGWLPTGSYLDQLYGNGTGGMENVPPLTDEAEDAEDPVAYEFAMALDFAQCAEEAGLREGTDEAWARMSVAKVIDREAEVYAWEQRIEDYLANAQEYLAGK